MTLAYKSRCARKVPVDYRWIGEPIDCAADESYTFAISHHFATRIAQEALSRGELKSGNFNQFITRVTSHTKAKLDELTEGKLKPGSDIKPLAGCADIDCHMTELRWEKTERTLEGNRPKVLVRHYVAEPSEVEESVFGLVLHRKLVQDLSHEEIAELQNGKIDEAKSICRQAIEANWTFDD